MMALFASLFIGNNTMFIQTAFLTLFFSLRRIKRLPRGQDLLCNRGLVLGIIWC